MADAGAVPTIDSGASPGDDLEKMPLDGVLAKLGTSAEGLSSAEAEKRLGTHGRNEITEKKQSPYLKFLSYFWGPIPVMIEVALVISIIIGDWGDAGVIAVLLVANSIIGWWEERQAGDAIEALKEKLAAEAMARRDGQWREIDARELVPGDAVRMRLGDVVPADVRLLDPGPLDIDQAALTGESLPVKRSGGEAAYSGSVVVKGEATAIVIGTGSHTYFGRTATLVAEAGTTSHFQQALLTVGKVLIGLAVVVVTIMFVVGVVAYGNDFGDMLELALVVTIAAVPVALPTVLSVTMAVGAAGLARNGAVVSHLPSIEEIGGVEILCSDKTGTLTQNKLAVQGTFVMPGGPATDAAGLLRDAALASETVNADPIDVCVVEAYGDELTDADQSDFVPFDPVSKRTEATVTEHGGTYRVAKGAPQVILDLPDDRPAGAADYERQVSEFASRGFRALGVARTDQQGRWHVAGLLGLADPPRSDSRETVQHAQELGVQVKMVTGDALDIAKEVASEVGLGEDILDASMLADPGVDVDELARRAEDADGFAQVFPEHKDAIVRMLQGRGHIVGMTGDGVNDAPALKQADAGIAVSGATDAARAAADIVLLTPGLSVIIFAIRSSREIFERMTSYAIYRIGETIRVLFVVALSIMLFNFAPITPLMIVLLALLNDGAILSIAYDNATGSSSPKGWDMQKVLSVAITVGVMGVIASFALMAYVRSGLGWDDAQVQTLLYLNMSVAGHFMIFVTRTRGPFWSTRPADVLILAVLGTQLLATAIAVTGFFGTGWLDPLPWQWALLVWGYAVLCTVFNDAAKLVVYRLLPSDPAERA